MTRLEERLRAQFAPERFPPGVSLAKVIAALWEQTTAPASSGVLRLIMDLSRGGRGAGRSAPRRSTRSSGSCGRAC